MADHASHTEVPSNYILTMFQRPGRYIGSLVIAWGIVMTLTGVVQNFGGLVATRFVLGIFESVNPSLTSFDRGKFQIRLRFHL